MHSSNSYEIHYIPKGKGTLISNQCSYELYPNILYTTGPHVEHQQYVLNRAIQPLNIVFIWK